MKTACSCLQLLAVGVTFEKVTFTLYVTLMGHPSLSKGSFGILVYLSLSGDRYPNSVLDYHHEDNTYARATIVHRQPQQVCRTLSLTGNTMERYCVSRRCNGTLSVRCVFKRYCCVFPAQQLRSGQHRPASGVTIAGSTVNCTSWHSAALRVDLGSRNAHPGQQHQPLSQPTRQQHSDRRCGRCVLWAWGWVDLGGLLIRRLLPGDTITAGRLSCYSSQSLSGLRGLVSDGMCKSAEQQLRW